MVGVATLNRAKYSGLDFDTHFDDNLARLQVKFAADFNDFALSGLAIVLLDSNAFGLDTLSFYLDRRATETYLSIARTRGAVSRLTRYLGYKMGAAISSSVDLSVAIRTPVAFDVPIEAGRTFLGPNSVVFTAAQGALFPAGSGPNAPKTIPCFEGQRLEESFVSDGTANQIFALTRVPDSTFVTQGSVTVFVDGAPFTENEFLTAEETDQFEFAANDDPPTIRFGDGSFGNIPTAGATILVEYVAGRGKVGQVDRNTITKIQNQLVVAFQTIALNITNNFPVVGGDDPETLAHAKIFAPRVAKSRKVAITREDYESLAGAYADPLFGRVAVAQAISARSAGLDIELQNLLQSIQDEVDAIQPAIDTAVTNIGNDVTVLETESAALVDDLEEIAALSANSTSQAGSLSNSLALIKEEAQQVSSEAANATSSASTALANINALAPIPQINKGPGETFQFLDSPSRIQRSAGNFLTEKMGAGMQVQATGSGQPANNTIHTVSSVSSNTLFLAGAVAADGPTANIDLTTDLTGNSRVASATKASVTSDVRVAQTQMSAAQGFATTIDSALAVSIDAVGLIEQDLASIGTDLVTPDTILNTASQRITTVMDPAIADISAEVVTLDAVVVDANNDVAQAIVDINAHITSFLSSDCKANLISVPILTRDAGGFYTAPSIGLLQSTQNFLDERKSASQVVSVTSGVRFLIAAVLSVRIGVARGFAESVVNTTASAEIDAVLRDRKFAKSLLVSEIDDAVKRVPGVGFRNVSILGYLTDPEDVNSVVLTDKLDSDGNLVISTGEIVTKGTVTITTESAVPLTC